MNNLARGLQKIEQDIERLIPEADAFAGWTEEELLTYATTGVKPKGKPEPRLTERDKREWAGWTKKELFLYATRGIKPLRYQQ